MCSHIKNPQQVLIKGSQHFPQDQEVRNGFKTFQNPLRSRKGAKKGKKKEKDKKGEKYQ